MRPKAGPPRPFEALAMTVLVTNDGIGVSHVSRFARRNVQNPFKLQDVEAHETPGRSATAKASGSWCSCADLCPILSRSSLAPPTYQLILSS